MRIDNRPTRPPHLQKGNRVSPEYFYEQVLHTFESRRKEDRVARFPIFSGSVGFMCTLVSPTALVPLLVTPALMHLAEDRPEKVDLTEDLWDSAFKPG